MREILETERLLLREFNLGDAPFIYTLLNTDSWIRYIGDRNIKSLQDAEHYLHNGPMQAYRNNGYGLWLVTLKESDICLGMCGIIKRSSLDHPDIGFAFLPEHTGKGYAFESARATLNYAFDELRLGKLLAITLPENQASIRLLEKIGLKFEREIAEEKTQERLFLFSTQA